MSIFDYALESIDRGRIGLNKGLPMGFNRLVQHLPNIQKSTYYLLGSKTKGGKTSFIDDCFMFNPYDYVISNPGENYKFTIDYFSYEIERTNKIIKGVTRKLYNDYGILTNVNEILSRGKNRISDEIYQKVVETRNYFERLEDYLTIFDMPDNPTGIYKYLMNKCEKNGKIIREPYETQDENGNKVTKQKFVRYIPNDPDLYHIVIIDHISLALAERNFSTKENIDKLSQYLVGLRNNFQIIPVVIQQLSFDSESTERKKLGYLQPTLGDFSDSRYTTRQWRLIVVIL